MNIKRRHHQVLKFVNFLSISVILTFYSCVGISDEEKLLKTLLEEKFDCNIQLRKGIESSTKEGEETYFEVEYSDCKAPVSCDLKASYSALFTYKELHRTLNVTHVYIKCASTDKRKYSINDLKRVENAEVFYFKIFELLKSGDYSTIHDFLWTKMKEDSSKNDFISKMEHISSLSEFKDIKVEGFEILTSNIDGHELEIIHLIGVYGSEENVWQFDLFLSKETDESEIIYGINFEEI